MSKEALARQKLHAAEAAVAFVRSGMVVGLGAGSTAAIAVRLIAALFHQGTLRDLVGIPCSREVEALAGELGLPLGDLNQCPVIDLTIDGADEVDPDLNLIKGRGGAMLREKIVAQASRRELIVVDAGKASPRLGTLMPVPVEVAPFGYATQMPFLHDLGAHPVLRLGADGAPFVTDQGNYVIDCHCGPIRDAVALANVLSARAGLLANGLFTELATDVIIGTDHGAMRLGRQ